MLGYRLHLVLLLPLERERNVREGGMVDDSKLNMGTGEKHNPLFFGERADILCIIFTERHIRQRLVVGRDSKT